MATTLNLVAKNTLLTRTDMPINTAFGPGLLAKNHQEQSNAAKN
jgi:hypothetical protein